MFKLFYDIKTLISLMINVIRKEILNIENIIQLKNHVVRYSFLKCGGKKA